MATERITFTLDTDDPQQKAVYDQIAALQNRSATLREIVMAYFNGEPVTNAEMSPAAPAAGTAIDYQQLENALYNAGKRLGLSIQVGTNGNGHHADPEPELLPDLCPMCPPDDQQPIAAGKKYCAQCDQLAAAFADDKMFDQFG